jgi:hypothetical protein
VFLVDERGEGRMSGGDPRSGVFYAVGVLGRGDDLKIFAFELLVDGLPPGQVKAAASP